MHFTRSARAGGYIVTTTAEGKTVERDSISCAHCQRHVIIPPGPPRDDLFGTCWHCSKFICVPCANLRTCTPWERQLEKIEARDRMLRAILG